MIQFEIPSMKDDGESNLLVVHTLNTNQEQKAQFQLLSKLFFSLYYPSYVLTSYHSLNKSFNIKPVENYYMAFKLKAWMVYLISLVILPYPTAVFIGVVIIQRPLETSLASALGQSFVWDMIIGGFVLGMYYSIKHEWKKYKKKKEQGIK